MEYNSARLKFSVLNGSAAVANKTAHSQQGVGASGLTLSELSLGQLCKLGLALTWPLALAVLIVGAMLVLVVRH